MRKSFPYLQILNTCLIKKLKEGAKIWILENVVKRNKDLRESANL
jgi:hypothetical protein